MNLTERESPPITSRRTFLKAAGALAAALPLLKAKEVVGSTSAGEGVRYSILYDSSACIGCNACHVACKTRRGFPIRGMVERELSPVNWVFVSRAPSGGQLQIPPFVRHSCMHCEDAMCQLVCPVGAIRKWNGLVYIDQSRCIGCAYCVEACPYGVPRKNEGPSWGDWAPHGVSRKCDGCYAFVREGKIPACVEACPADALRFGTRDKIVAEAQRRVSENPNLWIYGLNEFGGLGVIYIFPKGFDPVREGVFPEPSEGYRPSVSRGPIALGLAAVGGLALMGAVKANARGEGGE